MRGITVYRNEDRGILCFSTDEFEKMMIVMDNDEWKDEEPISRDTAESDLWVFDDTEDE